MKFEVALIPFLSDVFLAVAVGESAPSQSVVFFFLEKICALCNDINSPNLDKEDEEL